MIYRLLYFRVFDVPVVTYDSPHGSRFYLPTPMELRSSALNHHMNANWTTYAYTNRNCMRRLRTPRAIGCMDELPAAASEGRSTYFNERSCVISLAPQS
jgi:hypothetical protein